MKSPVKFAVVGFGLIGQRHATIISKHPQSELSAIVEIDPQKRTEARKQFRVPVFETLEAMRNAVLPVDVVSICTPNHLHAPLALRALDYRYHVIIEKPMALNRADCEKIIFKSLQVSRNVFVVKQNRYSPPSKWLKEIHDTGILGNIYMVQVNCYWNRDERYYKKGGWKGQLHQDGGILFTQFSHFIDIMYWVFGDIKNIHARFENFNHRPSTEFEDSGMATFDFVNGGMGCINFTTACYDKNMESSITVVAENGCLKIGGQYMNEVEYCHIKNYTLPVLEPTNPPNDYGPYKGSAANHHHVIQNVIDTIHGTASIDTNALEGMKVVDIIERIYAQRDVNRLTDISPTKAHQPLSL
ncbi:MAG: oxidoreductase [Chitinophagales bacterium]|nr:MAG: oxidoreductase [Chitinophagales bacterium]